MTPAPQNLDALRIDKSAREPRGGLARWWTIASILVLVLIGAGAFLLIPNRAPVVVVAEVRSVSAASAGAGTVLNATGYVTARRRATVAAKITGRLVEVRIEEGMEIAEGDVLARLDDSQYRAALELARSQLGAAQRAIDETAVRLELAETTLGRSTRLVAEGVADQATLDAARNEVEALRARLAFDRQQAEVAEREVRLRQVELDDTVVRAPFSGVVISKDAQAGEMVSPVSAGGGFTRTGIGTVVDMASLEIEVDVNESFISRVRPGQPVEAVLDAYPDWRIPAHVITTVPTADRQKATVLVRIGFDALDPKLLPDMGVSVAFQETVQPADATTAARPRLLLPAAAVRRDGERDVVLVVQNDRVERRAVRVGVVSGTEIEALSGLSAGERVVVEGPATLADGDRVRVR